jgi:uncharacterized glyoxalase superfamily protein PhnB
MPPRLEYIGFVVSDMPASLDFYRALGFEIAEGMNTEPHVDIELHNGMRLSWDTHEMMRSFNPNWQPRTGTGHSAEIALNCDAPAEVDAIYARMTEAGYTGAVPPFDAFWGHRYAVLHDPDGNGVALFANRPDAAPTA